MTDTSIKKRAARGEGMRRGLTSPEAERSRAEHGANILTQKKRRSFLARFVSNLGDPVIKVLLCALAANIIFTFQNSDWVETAGIAASILLATLISTFSEYSGEAAYARLSGEADGATCRVRRDGVIKELPVGEVVVGDIVLIGAGDAVPADGVIISGRVFVDQSAMTGESREVEKLPCTSRSGAAGEIPDPGSEHSALRGCLVLSGAAEMEVTSVGDATYLGGISEEVQVETRDSPLKVRLSRLASQISRLGYAAAAVVAAAYLINAFVLDSGGIWSVILMKLCDTRYLFSKLVGALTLGLTVVVVAVPEGLPMMIAVVLSANIKRMIRSGVLVRKPVGIEAAGSMNILFTDKTGTLTHGRMAVGEILLGDGKSFEGARALCQKSPSLWRLYRESALLNTASDIGADGSGRRCPIGGNSADRAFMRSVLENEEGGEPLPRVIKKQLFDSAKKYSACIVEAESRVFIKGAPELLLPRITACMSADGAQTRFDARAFGARLSEIRRRGGRVLLLAWGHVGAAEMSGAFGNIPIPGELCLIAAVSLEDSPRRDAADAVKELRGAGIHVVMITGDSAETAWAIGHSCGILGAGVDMVLESAELARLTDGRLCELLPRIGVIARALPADKSRLVRVAQESGLVVGMTGDGINDAPALRRADIGFAMGSGTQVARDAGDIVILDDRLSSISNAVLYGRNIFKSIRKFITLQLTMNFSAVGVSMIGPFLGIDAPVTVVQMLWINIIMDTLGGLAFAGEPALPSCMREKPKRRDEPILNRYMVNQILFLGGFTVLLSLCFLKLPFFTRHFRESDGDICLLTAFFAFFIFAGVFNCFNARTDRLRLLAGIKRNPTFIVIMSAVLIIQIGFVYLGGTVLRTVSLLPGELMWAMACSALVFPAELTRKLWWRLRGGRGGF